MHRTRTASFTMGAIAAIAAANTSQAANIPGSTLQPTVWLKADALNGVNTAGNPNALPANNSAVASWLDSSGNGRNATQGVAAQRPLFVTSQVNGKPVVRFDGSSTAGQGDFMSIIGGPLANTALSDMTLFIVSNDNRLVGDTNNKAILSTRDNNGDGWVETYEPSSKDQRYVHIGLGTSKDGVVDDNMGTDKFHVLEVRRDGLTIELGHDGGLQVKDTLDGFKPTLLGVTHIGNNNNDVNRFLRGDIAEIIAFDNRYLNDAERSQVEQYLLNKYAITPAVPVPEPVSLGALGLVGAGLLGRRRRN
jgi:hypothetical protein